MSKIYKLFVDENIKTWKKFSTKLAIILIGLALLGALSLSKLLQYIDEKNDINSESFVSSSEEGFKGEIEILKEQLQDNTLSKSEKEEIERQIKIYEIRIKNQIYRTDWRSEALADINIDNKTLEIVEKNDFDGYMDQKQEKLKKKFDDKQISQEEYDDEKILLELQKKYGISKDDPKIFYDYRAQVISDICQKQKSIRTGIDSQTNKVLTEKQKKQYEDDIKISIYKIENNIEKANSTSDYKMTFESFATSFVTAFIAIFVIIVAGSAIATEISTGTIKFWALTPNKRWKILTAKILSLLFYLVVITLIMALLTLVCGKIFFTTEGNAYLYVKDGVVQKIGNTAFIIEYYFAKIIPIIIFALFALMLSVVTRNTSVAIALSIATYMGNVIMMLIINTYIKKDWIKFIPFNNLDIASKIFTNFTNPMTISAPNSFVQNTSLIFSLGVLGVCAILMLVTMYDSFNKRDII